MKIKYDINLMHYMSTFSAITGTDAKDAFTDDFGLLVFVVKENDIGKALGKHGSRARMLEKALNRKIKILEFNPELQTFIKNLVQPVQLADIQVEGKKVLLTAADSRGRGMLIGRSAQNLRNFEKAAKRYFDIEEIKVL